MAEAAATAITGRLADALYTEAMLLADELRAYLDGPAAEAKRAMPPRARVLFACESLNATTRVMQITARLLARRAGDDRVAVLPDVAPPDAAAASLLPPEARRLLAAGQDLYERVRRLDGPSPPSPANPARALFDRLERAF